MLELLQAHPGLSGAELASRLEVDRRTVRRYITMLQDLGIPVEATRGPYGSYRLRPGFKLPPLMVSDEEAIAITLSLIAARRQGLAPDPLALEGALAKIERVLPEALRARIQAVEAVVAFAPPSAKPQPPSATITLLSTAIQQQHTVQMRYRSRNEETERLFDPYGLVVHWELWYSVGWCHLRQEVRVFRLDRILALEPTQAHFTSPQDFDSVRHVLDGLATAPSGWAVEVLVETSLAEAREQIPPGNAVLTQTAAGVVLRTNVERLDWLARQLLRLDCPFVVRYPEELRVALREVASQALAMAERQEGQQPV